MVNIPADTAPRAPSPIQRAAGAAAGAIIAGPVGAAVGAIIAGQPPRDNPGHTSAIASGLAFTTKSQKLLELNEETQKKLDQQEREQEQQIADVKRAELDKDSQVGAANIQMKTQFAEQIARALGMAFSTIGDIGSSFLQMVQNNSQAEGEGDGDGE
jgi:hypothetical protein